MIIIKLNYMNILRRTLFVSVMCFCQSVIAQANHVLPAVDMVSYEQSWIDSEGTLALKNNTSEDIYNITFILEYLDMQGNPMDYETYSYNIDIAPGMTKKLNIPAYEARRHYHYYKTKDKFGNPAFKLRYELKDFNNPNIKTTDVSENIYSLNAVSEYDNNHSRGIAISIILILLFGLGIYVGLYILVAVMAQRRNRNPVLWLFLSFIATPLLICIILLVIGKEYRTEY